MAAQEQKQCLNMLCCFYERVDLLTELTGLVCVFQRVQWDLKHWSSRVREFPLEIVYESPGPDYPFAQSLNKHTQPGKRPLKTKKKALQLHT